MPQSVAWAARFSACLSACLAHCHLAARPLGDNAVLQPALYGSEVHARPRGGGVGVALQDRQQRLDKVYSGARCVERLGVHVLPRSLHVLYKVEAAARHVRECGVESGQGELVDVRSVVDDHLSKARLRRVSNESYTTE